MRIRLNKKTIMFLILIILVEAISFVMAFKGDNNRVIENYGTTSDGQLSVSNDMEIVLEFTIPRNYFKGITIRLSSAQANFEEETLDFTMIDQNTGEILNEYKMDMDKEVYSSDTLASLPLEQSKGKKVKVHIVGDNIHNEPVLFISNQSNLESTTYVNGIKQKYNLVFAGVYAENSKYNVRWIIKGIVYLLLIVLIYLFPVNEDENKRIQLKNNLWLNKIRERVVSFCKKYKRIIIFWGLTALYGVLIYFVYKTYVAEVIWRRQKVVVVKENKKVESQILTKDSGLCEMDFIADNNYLSSFEFNVQVQNVEPYARIHVQVFDENQNICYHDGYVWVEDIQRNGSKWKVFMDKEFTFSNSQKVLIFLQPEEFGTTEILFRSGTDDEVNFYQSGQLRHGTPVLKVYYADNEYLKVLFSIFCALVYGFFILIYIFFAYFHVSVEQAYVPVVLALGILYMLIIPVYSVPDEYTHIDTAYIISNRLLGLQPVMDSYEYKRVEDVETEQAPEYSVTLVDYRRLYTSFFRKAKNTGLVSCYTKNGISNANIICYLPAAVGICIGRLLEWGTLPMFMLGRFMNLLIFTLLTYLCILKLPGGKRVAMLFLSLPIVLQEAASFSYDSIVDAICVLFITYCMYFAFDKQKKSLVDISILLYGMVFMSSIKGGVYIPLCGLLILIPLEQKWMIRNKIKYFGAVIFLMLLSFAQNNIADLFSRLVVKDNGGINPFSGAQMYTFGYLLKHPFEFISLYINTFFTESSRYIYEIFGGKMGSVYNVQMPWMYVLIFLLIMISAIYTERGQIQFCNYASFPLTVLVVILSVFLVNLSMLIANTDLIYKSIQGVQGRYFIPCVFALIILVNYKVSGGKDDIGRKTNIIYFITHIVFLMNIVMIVMR